ncbi:MAG: hypothetical protein F9K18_10255 [Thermoanaerobaculia bacterium]|nr:MAG: hypothetical protein F9K18_10255 [Thermoanaerobaculia bacterium]
MIERVLRILAAGALCAAVAVAQPTTSGGRGGVQVQAPAPASPSAVLYDQMDNPAGANANVTSQDFEAGFDQFDAQIADDFSVPAEGWTITSVDVDGDYSAAGPAASFNVYFYADGGAIPGALVASRLGQTYAGAAGDASITLVPPVALAAGDYWVSVQARQDFGTAGQWFWHNRTVQTADGAAFQNPGDGFGTGCTTWNTKMTCLPSQVGPDQLYRLNGTVISCADCPPWNWIASGFTGATTQVDRIFRDGSPSNCPGEPFPGMLGGSTVLNYEAFVFANVSARNACVRVLFDPDAGATPCGVNAHAVLYSPSYDPANQGLNYLGDVGSSVRQNFRAEVPAGAPFTVVVVNTTSAALCTFNVAVVNAPCQIEFGREFVGDFSGGSSGTQLGRLFRDGIPSTCGNKAFPGVFNPGSTYNYETASGSNPSTHAACYEIEFNPNQCPTPCGVNAHASVHSPAYNPADMSQGYLADVGSSVEQSFFATLAGGAPFTVAVTNTSSQANCTYSLVARPSIFGDGFEWWDTMSWSSVVP